MLLNSKFKIYFNDGEKILNTKDIRLLREIQMNIQLLIQRNSDNKTVNNSKTDIEFSKNE